MELPEVVECHLMAGDCDYLLRVVAADLDAYRSFQTEHLARIKGVRNSKTEIPMEDQAVMGDPGLAGAMVGAGRGGGVPTSAPPLGSSVRRP